MSTLAYYHDTKSGIYRICSTLTGRKQDAVWVDVTPESYWQQFRGPLS